MCGVLGQVPVLASPRRFWLGSVVCVFGFAFCFQPSNPCWGVSRCLFLRAFCLYPAIPGCILRVFFRACILASPRQSWLGSVVCVFGLGFYVYPASPGWGCCCVCLGPGFDFTHPILAGVFRCVCLCARSAFTLPIQCWGLWCVGSGLRFGLIPLILAGVLVLCVFEFGFSFHPANPRLGLGLCVCVRASRLYPANHGWGLGCVCLGTGFGSTPPILAWLLGVCVLVCVLCLFLTRISGLCVGSGFAFTQPFLAMVFGCLGFCARSTSTLPILAGVRGVCV